MQLVQLRQTIRELRDRVDVLEAEQRREHVRKSMQVDALGTWRNLAEYEKNDKEYFLMALSSNPCIFAEKNKHPVPWDADGHQNRDGVEIIPHRFEHDRDAVLTYLSSDYYDNAVNGRFSVPFFLRGDKEVMLKACRKGPTKFAVISATLNDDEDVILAALQMDHSFYMRASDRLKSDCGFALKAIATMTVRDLGPLDMVLRFCKLSSEEKKRVVLSFVQRLPYGHEWGPYCEADNCFVLLSALRDDADVMVEFVKRNWRALEYCSDRLKRSPEMVSEATSQDIKALRFALGPSYEKEYAARQKHVVVCELENGLISFDDVPSHLTADYDVLLAAYSNGVIDYENLPNHLKEHKEFLIASRDLAAIPNHHWRDEEFCVSFLQALSGEKLDDDYFHQLLERAPSLLQSRDAVMAITKLDIYGHEGYLAELISECPFRDDFDVMLSACEKSSICFSHASERLKSDRFFVFEVLSRSRDASIIGFIPLTFLSQNLDILSEAKRLCKNAEWDTADSWPPVYFSSIQDSVFWENRSAVKACLEIGWPVLQFLVPPNPFLEDPELVRLAVQGDPLQLRYASSLLKDDREFILSLVKLDGRSLRYADETIQRDYDILSIAVANCIETVNLCFNPLMQDDFDFLALFASYIRSRLELYESFVSTFLCGISVVRPPAQAPSIRCQLPRLDQGTETSVSFKRTIAQFAGIPFGAELRTLRKVSLNLKKLGF